MPLFLALVFQYGGVPDLRQSIIGALVFFAIYSAPLLIMATTLHRLPERWRGWISTLISISGLLLAAATPGGVLADGAGLLFAVISLGAAIDLFHLQQPFPAIGFFCGLPSLLFVGAFTQQAFQHAILSSYRY